MNSFTTLGAMERTALVKVIPNCGSPRTLASIKFDIYDNLVQHFQSALEYFSEEYGDTRMQFTTVFDCSASCDHFKDLVANQQLNSRDYVVCLVPLVGVATVNIILKGIAYSTPDEIVTQTLSIYGTVYSVKRGTFPNSNCQNGSRYIVMDDPNANIPSLLMVGDRKVLVCYPGQIRTCFRCDSLHHVASQCPNIRCFKCGLHGHVQKSCITGSVCMEIDMSQFPTR